MDDSNQTVTLTYVNHKGIKGERTVLPIQLWFGVSQWHEGEQWFLKAWDMDKEAERDFAMKDVMRWNAN